MKRAVYHQVVGALVCAGREDLAILVRAMDMPGEVKKALRSLQEGNHVKIPPLTWQTEWAEEVATRIAEHARQVLYEEQGESAPLGAIWDYAGDQMSDAGVPQKLIKKVLRKLGK